MVSQMKCIKNDKWALHNIGLTSLDYNHYPSWWYSNLLTPNLRFPHELIHYVSFQKFGWICTLVVLQVGSNMVGKALIIMNIVIFVMWSSCLFYFRKLHLCFKYNRSQIQYLHSLSYHSLLLIDHKRPLRDVGQEHKGTYYREINDVFVNVLHTRSTKEPTPRPSSSSYSINRKTSF